VGTSRGAHPVGRPGLGDGSSAGALIRRWPVGPATIDVPVRVVPGDQDLLAPAAHDRHTAGLVPGATLEVIAGQEHLSIVRRFPPMLAALGYPTARPVPDQVQYPTTSTITSVWDPGAAYSAT
jgi:hypothetical protein